jgi:hypothetical protein
LQFIMDLPGRKILLRGNHDMFWDAKRNTLISAPWGRRIWCLPFVPAICCSTCLTNILAS